MTKYPRANELLANEEETQSWAWPGGVRDKKTKVPRSGYFLTVKPTEWNTLPLSEKELEQRGQQRKNAKGGAWPVVKHSLEVPGFMGVVVQITWQCHQHGRHHHWTSYFSNSAPTEIATL